MIKILIVDDHDIVVYGLTMLFEKQKDFKVCATATHVLDALEKVSIHRPDIVLMDMRLPDGDGISAGQRIKQLYPDVKVVLLTAFDSNTIKLEANRAKIDGFLLKHINNDELCKAIRNIANQTIKMESNQNIVFPMGKIKLKGQLDMSEKECEILSLIALGKTNQEIANELFCSEKTIRNQVTAIYQKINVTNRSEAILFWMRLQMLE